MTIVSDYVLVRSKDNISENIYCYEDFDNLKSDSIIKVKVIGNNTLTTSKKLVVLVGTTENDRSGWLITESNLKTTGCKLLDKYSNYINEPFYRALYLLENSYKLIEKCEFCL